MSKFLDKTGLTYFFSKLKAKFGASISTSGATVSLKNANGTVLSSATVDNVNKANKLTNTRTITVGNTGKSFDGSANISYSLAEIGTMSEAEIKAYIDAKVEEKMIDILGAVGLVDE